MRAKETPSTQLLCIRIGCLSLSISFFPLFLSLSGLFANNFTIKPQNNSKINKITQRYGTNEIKKHTPFICMYDRG